MEKNKVLKIKKPLKEAFSFHPDGHFFLIHDATVNHNISDLFYQY